MSRSNETFKIPGEVPVKEKERDQEKKDRAYWKLCRSDTCEGEGEEWKKNVYEECQTAAEF